eukprot:gnl/TRDRNA2_/TRDRNA2_189416_c0_seq1.p1 gnl/TRDRNA2_/TRDRNA2_189416_c0~~gnl/TRDRNA2_/TRDRNA2_189416_c0_seq1.p1  ORF type:complete len:222 (+),score=60.55 gnl/TRDRNA2_/TRDRNA2_189416_c0_seq1:83-748(+)
MLSLSSLSRSYADEMRKLKATLDEYEAGTLPPDEAYKKATDHVNKAMQLVEDAPDSAQLIIDTDKALGKELSVEMRRELSDRYNELEMKIRLKSATGGFASSCCLGRDDRESIANLHGALPTPSRSSVLGAMTYDLESDFKAAGKATIKQKGELGIGTWDLLKLYGLYRQGNEGDCNKPQPGMFSIAERQKWNAWNELKGKPQKEAQTEYIEFAKKCGIKW